MSLDDFVRLRPAEFEAVCRAYSKGEECRERSAWERMRLQATIAVQPHCRKEVSPKKLIPLPWDSSVNEDAPKLSRAEAYERFKHLTETAP